MEYTKISKKIRSSYATLKFWYLGWTKDNCTEVAAKIRTAIAELKTLVDTAIAVGCDLEDRRFYANVRKEVVSFEATVGTTNVVYVS